MSKFELRNLTRIASGISFEESEVAMTLRPSLYERLGQDGFEELSTLFYDRVFEDKGAIWFLNIFSSSTRTEAIENQVCTTYKDWGLYFNVWSFLSLSLFKIVCQSFFY